MFNTGDQSVVLYSLLRRQAQFYNWSQICAFTRLDFTDTSFIVLETFVSGFPNQMVPIQNVPKFFVSGFCGQFILFVTGSHCLSSVDLTTYFSFRHLIPQLHVSYPVFVYLVYKSRNKRIICFFEYISLKFRLQNTNYILVPKSFIPFLH